MKRELDRMLRRVRSNSLPVSVLESALQREIDRLANEPEALGNRSLTPGPALERLGNAFDTAIWEAYRRHAESRFVEALAAIHRADAGLAVLRRLEHASAEREAAERERGRLVAMLGLEPFLRLPALRIVDRLLTRSATLIGAGEPHKTLVVVRLARRLLARLELRAPAPDGGLGRRLERLSREVAGEATSPRLEQVRALARDGYVTLALRLADELEIELAGWRATSRVPEASDRWRHALIRGLAETERMAESLALRLGATAKEQ